MSALVSTRSVPPFCGGPWLAAPVCGEDSEPLVPPLQATPASARAPTRATALAYRIIVPPSLWCLPEETPTVLLPLSGPRRRQPRRPRACAPSFRSGSSNAYTRARPPEDRTHRGDRRRPG